MWQPLPLGMEESSLLSSLESLLDSRLQTFEKKIYYISQNKILAWYLCFQEERPIATVYGERQSDGKNETSRR
jgi:hypothetical protein